MVGRVVELPGDPRGCATGRPDRRTGRRPRGWPRSRRRRSTVPADSIWTTPMIRSLTDPRQVGVADRAHRGAARPQGHAALPDRRVAQIRDGLANLGDRPELREHDPGCPEIERSPDAQSLRGRYADDRGHRRRADGVQQCRAGPLRSPTPCSRSSTSQSNPAWPQSSAASGEARSENVPMRVSPAWIRVLRSVMADMMPGPRRARRDAGSGTVDQPGRVDDLEVRAR